MLIRPMRLEDVAGAERLSAETNLALELATHRVDDPPDGLRPGPRAARWRRRAEHLIGHDGPGCWVAEDEHGLAGVVISLRRESIWGLSAFYVATRVQGRGIGKQLLEASIDYGRGCLSGIICSSHDPRAVRRYRLAGFTVHPAMQATGAVDRGKLPVVDGVREGTAGDFDLADSVDRQIRGGGHGPDHAVLLTELTLLVTDQLTGSGYCYVDEDGGPRVMAATSPKIARRLMWAALARSTPGRSVQFGDLTAEQEWAVDVALAAGLQIHHDGYLCLRHLKPPMPYIPSAHFL